MHTTLANKFRSLLFIGLFLTFDALALDNKDFSHLNQATIIRAEQWQALMENAKFATDQQKLQQVNDFFNQNIRFADDLKQWNTVDYWATPNELLAVGAGDCEDYSIAKYFSLLELGIDADKLRITYVKLNKLKTAHMVLSYLAYPGATPLVLDNLIPEIKPASQRNDLIALFSFNHSGLWLANFNGHNKKVSPANHLTKWSHLKNRMQVNNQPSPQA